MTCAVLPQHSVCGASSMKSAIVASLLALTMAAGAWADEPAKPGAGKRPGGPGGAGRGQMFAKLFEKADTNGDGKVSKEEFKKAFENAPGGRMKGNPQMADRLFDRLDANKDGFLTKDEMQNAGKQMQGRRPGGGKPGAKKPGAKVDT